MTLYSYEQFLDIDNRDDEWKLRISYNSIILFKECQFI